MSDKDVWAATQLSKHREQIRVLEAQVTALHSLGNLRQFSPNLLRNQS